MAEINVSDILLDPDFVDSLTLVHRASTVDAYGKNQLVSTSVLTVGSVQPISGKELERIPEALRGHDVRSFWIKAELVTGGPGSQYPDQILFQNKTFTIKSAESWANWGAGWYKGICVVEAPAGG